MKAERSMADAKLTSQVIDFLRFPLIMAVVLIHCFGPWEVDVPAIHANPWSLNAIYNFTRIIFSSVLTQCAVPAFFVISGYLFFLNMKEWDWHTYGRKMRSRFWSLLVPYVLWICIFVLRVEVFFFGSWLFHDGPAEVMRQWIADRGGISCCGTA